MANKYEQLIDLIINEEQDKARELFHEIVIEKSRDIYESLIDETDISEINDEDSTEIEELANEIVADEQGISEEEGEEGEEAEVDMEMDAEEAPEEEHEEIEDRVEDLEDALDELKAEFDALMAGEAEEPEHADMEVPAEDMMEETDEVAEEAVEEATEETTEETTEEVVREYVEKAPAPKTSEEGANTKSPVAGKNDMGGKAVDVTAGGEEKGAKVAPKGELPHDGLTKPGADAGKAFKKA